MADYFTHFSCILDVGSPENAARALELHDALANEDGMEDLPSDGFLLSIQPENSGQLWIRDDVSGDPEQLIRFVKRCAAEFGLTGLWGFQFATTCSQARVNAFGGGAHALDLATGETVDRIDSGNWLEIVLDGGDPYA
ncbi:hypothetical protein [Paracoccus siganidrum]|uniref:Uncharacterized protein n=1 Tax=Paracoccus siganidrum TaxID=1276757 RepID=A0A419A6N8_9RHOB|nr:hypothetical protein [Paracoccus siganidrum]RJL15808.1 hypothetical protein D3P05_10495 [Paracoccus siganidrum]RMC29379.1 hypothetical protein C9E82_20505 [Paracoccus siganidrum]